MIFLRLVTTPPANWNPAPTPCVLAAPFQPHGDPARGGVVAVEARRRVQLVDHHVQVRPSLSRSPGGRRGDAFRLKPSPGTLEGAITGCGTRGSASARPDASGAPASAARTVIWRTCDRHLIVAVLIHDIHPKPVVTNRSSKPSSPRPRHRAPGQAGGGDAGHQGTSA